MWQHILYYLKLVTYFTMSSRGVVNSNSIVVYKLAKIDTSNFCLYFKFFI